MNQPPLLPRRIASMIKLVCGSAAVMLVLVGCSSDADTAATTSTSAKSSSATTTPGAGTTAIAAVVVPPDPTQVAAVVDFAVAKGADEGFVFDRLCVEQIVSQLSVDDVEALYVPTLDSVPGAIYPSLSADGAALTEQMTTCLQPQGGDKDLISQVVAVFLQSAEGPTLDTTCLQDQVATLNDEQLHAVLDAEAGSNDPDLAKALGVVYICQVQLSS
ncbi:MAG: hypothetical protein ABIR32_03780 [Ilumatobacteraceae bacterium]